MKESKKVCKADSSYDMGFLLEKDEREPTEFEMLKAKVSVMEEILTTLQMIIVQNNLVYKSEKDAKGDINDMTFRLLDEEDEL